MKRRHAKRWEILAQDSLVGRIDSLTSTVIHTITRVIDDPTYQPMYTEDMAELCFVALRLLLDCKKAMSANSAICLKNVKQQRGKDGAV